MAIHIWSPTPPARNARLSELALGVELARALDHRELLPDELFTRDGERWLPNWSPPLQGLLITWETAGARS